MRIFESEAGAQPAHRVLGLSRRQLGMLAGLVAAGTVGAACSEESIRELFEQIANRPVRRDINTLEPGDNIIQSYATAVEAMRSLGTSDPRNWIRQADIHAQRCRHANWLFLPWHRAYLFYFEQICRELSGDDSFALPYWNWTANPQIPAVFRDPDSPLYHESRRDDQAARIPESVVGEATVDAALAPTNFLNFASAQVGLNHPPPSGPGFGPLEGGPHNGVHVFVGGPTGDMTFPPRAARDPIFWLHHARVDELWVQWNVVRENPNTNHSDWMNTVFDDFVNADGTPAQVQVRTVVLYPLLAHRYDSQEVV